LGKPLESSTEFDPAGLTLVSSGARAATRYWWLRNEPPNAPWKKLSATT